MDLEIVYNFTNYSTILAPIFRQKEYCEWLNITFKGKFILPHNFYNNPKSKLFVGSFLLYNIIHQSDYCLKYACLNLLENILRNDFETTLSIYQVLPGLITTDKIDDEIIEIAKNNYFGTFNWLYAWDKKFNTYEYKISDIGWLEKHAFTKLKRYELIRELFSNKYIENYLPGHNSTWLICEYNLLLASLNCKAENVNQIYLTKKNYLDNLNDFTKSPDSVRIKGLLNNLISYIDTIARQKAEEDPYFDKHYFRPYITAERSENADTQKSKLKLISTTHKLSSKPGRKLGQKRKY